MLQTMKVVRFADFVNND